MTKVRTQEFVFRRHVDIFMPVNKDGLENTYPVLPGGNYVVGRSMEGQFYLQMIRPFEHPPKIYGDTMRHASRIRKTFESRPAATGVLLNGEKGSGKTLLARTICIEAAASGIPTIVINAPWSGDSFYSFLCSITQPCIVLFDEFEKTYDVKKNEQDSILTLLDGVFPTKKLFLLTCNDRYGINTNMINRPGRIFYALEFTGLDESFIRDYTADNLNNKEQVDSVVRITKLFSQFNFDMLKALIEEMNRYSETASEALSLLNVSPAYDYLDYKATIIMANGTAIDKQNSSPDKVRSPMGQKNGMNFHVVFKNPEYRGREGRDDDNDHEEYLSENLHFHPGDILNIEGDSLLFKNKQGHLLKLVRERYDTYDWRKSANINSGLDVLAAAAAEAEAAE